VKRLPNDSMFPHMTLCTLVTNWFCGNPSTKMLPLKFLVPADFKSHCMKCEHQKMKVTLGNVIAGLLEQSRWGCGMGKMALGMFQGQSDYMKVCSVYLNTQAKQLSE
jgi:hypothetical protein